MSDNNTILVVDDTHESLKLLTDILRMEGYKVLSADSGSLALASVAVNAPELILLDIFMPDMDGFDVLQKLKEREESRDIPVIFLSALTEAEKRVEGLKLGAVDFITKPFQREELLVRVKNHLELYQMKSRIKQHASVLFKANEQLQTEIADHKRAEEEKQKLEEQLRQSQKMEAIGVLAGGVAHDFNNILMAIIGFGSMAQKRLKDDQVSHDYVKEMLAGANRAAELTRGLLAFSRKQVIMPKTQNLNGIVFNIEKMLCRIIGEDIEFRAVLGSRDIIVNVDAAQIDQVLMNLVTNARDAMPDGGELIIETGIEDIDESYAVAHLFEKPGKYAVLTVSDTGRGMDLKTRENIFEPFFTTKGIGRGTGLGLAMVYGIIKQHEGNITVDSEPGKGTTFRIYLPLMAAVEKRKEAGTEQPVPLGKGETILIAEDDADVRRIIRLYLQDNGYKTIEAKNGEEAVTVYLENRDSIALLILDVIMPVKNGKNAYDDLKTSRPDIKAIFMSGYTDDILANKGIIQEGFEFIPKPIDPDDMLRKIRAMLDRQ
ncbi:MAG: response regulator [Nitrospirae bacterium]|nr:response regulator [Nitrospirota bacterium]